MFKKVKILIVCVSLMSILSFYGCGPMNKQTSENKEGAVKVGSTTTTINKKYYIYTSIKPSGDNTLPDSQLGDNTCLVRLADINDLSTPSEEAIMDVMYWMPEMPLMGKKELKAERQDDGSFTFPIFFSMGGLWEVNLSLRDGEIQDDYVFETNL